MYSNATISPIIFPQPKQFAANKQHKYFDYFLEHETLDSKSALAKD